MDLVFTVDINVLHSPIGVSAARITPLGITAYDSDRRVAVQKCREMFQNFCKWNMEAGHLERMLQEAGIEYRMEPEDNTRTLVQIDGDATTHFRRVGEWRALNETVPMETRLAVGV